MSFRHKSVVYVRTADKIPTVEHWAIIRSSSYTTEASGQWAPGHGYPASTENYIEYEAYTDKAEFDEAVAEAAADRWGKTFRVIHVKPLSIKTTVTVETK